MHRLSGDWEPLRGRPHPPPLSWHPQLRDWGFLGSGLGVWSPKGLLGLRNHLKVGEAGVKTERNDVVSLK